MESETEIQVLPFKTLYCPFFLLVSHVPLVLVLKGEKEKQLYGRAPLLQRHDATQGYVSPVQNDRG